MKALISLILSGKLRAEEPPGFLCSRPVRCYQHLTGLSFILYVHYTEHIPACQGVGRKYVDISENIPYTVHMEEATLLTIPQAAALLGISSSAVYRAIREGKLPAVTILGKQGLRKQDIDAYQPRAYRDRPGAKPVGRGKQKSEGSSVQST